MLFQLREAVDFVICMLLAMAKTEGKITQRKGRLHLVHTSPSWVEAFGTVSGWCCLSYGAMVGNDGSGGIRLALGSPSRPCGVCNLNRLHKHEGWGRSSDCHEVL